MRIARYLFEAFRLETADTKVAIDPGQHLRIVCFRRPIPDKKSQNIARLFITPGIERCPGRREQSERKANVCDGVPSDDGPLRVVSALYRV